MPRKAKSNPSTTFAGIALEAALKATPAAVLFFYPFGIVLRKATEKGSIEILVSPKELTRVFAQQVRMETGLLGGNTLYVSITGAERVVAEWRPPQVTGLWMEGIEGALRVPLPGMVLIRRSSAMKARYSLFACLERPTDMKTKLYAAPLPNVGGDGICWGTVTRVSKAALAGNDLAEDWQKLLGSPFGSHNVAHKSKKHPKDIRLMLTEQAGRETYSLDDLMPEQSSLETMLEAGR